MNPIKLPLSKEKESIIDKAYRNPMFGMGSGYILYKHLRELGETYDKIKNPDGITVANVKDFLGNQETNQVLANRKRNFNSFVAEAPLDQFQIDLVYMPKSWFNQGYKYIFCCVDVFSKKADMVPMKERDAETSTEVMKKIIKTMGIPKSIYSDQGSEFNNKPFLELMKKHNVTVIFALDHAPFIESFNKTMKNRMYKYMAVHDTDNWSDVIKVLLDAYNNSPHTSTKIAPNKINNNNIVEARLNMLSKAKKKIYDEILEGDTVRVPVVHKVEKGFKQQWTYETLKVNKLLGNGLYEVDGNIYPRKELKLIKSAPIKNKPLNTNLIESREKENKIGTAQNSKLLKELSDFNSRGEKETKKISGSRSQVVDDLSSGRVLRSSKQISGSRPQIVDDLSSGRVLRSSKNKK